MDTPQSEGEARSHIAQIRKTKGLDGPETNTSDLGNALIILSEQLYQKSTHFLSELIQNADDNTYEALLPTLNITYANRTLRIDCNEVGFNKGNVEAICKIGRSTKAGLGNMTRYIGEKGIGFKSVFKVAEVVWILSGRYTFKFDKNETLGMIAPIWDDFPEPRLSGYTSILLQLSADYDTGELVDEIKSLDPRLLIFLRQLKQVHVTSYGRDGRIWRSSLGRHDAPATMDGASIVHLHHNAAFSSFKIIRFPVLEMPPDPKRPGCTESEILLAFPITQSGEPWIALQKVYAFLPIRDHGFKFLLQADFLLIANREDIDTSSAWNQRLLVVISEAFLRAVQVFNNGGLRYSWIRYLSNRPPLSDFFEHLESATRRLLSSAEVVESLSGSLVAPWKLKYVPRELSDENGVPLIHSDHTTSKYISPKYSAEDKDGFFRLGIQALSTREFLDDLRFFILKTPELFHGMPSAWHSSLSKALIRMINDDVRMKDVISQLEIIPLKDGQWVPASLQNICFSDSAEKLSIPKGISIVEINLHSTSDISRRSLFILLGAKTFSKDLVCDAIVKAQEEPGFEPDKLAVRELISHAVFLYEASWKNSGKHDLWVVTESELPKRGLETYMDSDEPHSATKFFEGKRERFPFIHRDYFRAVSPNDGSWKTWLFEHLNVAEYPRLVSALVPNLVLAKDFRFFLDADTSISLLLLFRDRWEHYSKWFLPDENANVEVAKAKLREKVATISVACRGGGKAPLNQTVLPLNKIITADIDSLAFLDIPNPDDSRWRYLRHFGVVVDTGVGQFLQCLRQLKETGASLERASELYRQTQAHSLGHIEMIRKTFETEELIFIPIAKGRSRKNWVSASICVWDGPKWLQKTPCLKDFYPEHYAFFCFTLRFHAATWRTMMDEAQNIDASDNVDYISGVFVAINDSLEESNTSMLAQTREEMVSTLKQSCIFPIDAGKSNSAFDFLGTAQESDIWFIADRWHLRQSFEGLVPLLALNVESVEKIQSLTKTLGLKHRLLSQVARGIPKTNGPTQPHSKYTGSLRAKSKQIARLLPKDLINRKMVIAQLCNIVVYTSEKVIIQWAIKINQKGNVLQIFLRQNDADAAHPPLELREHLTIFCGITEPSHVALLHWVLSEHDLQEIDNGLSRRGILKNVPEFDDITVLAAGQNPGFWGVDVLPSEQTAENHRRYHGRKPKLKLNESQFAASHKQDTVQSFINKFNLASSFQSKISQPWPEAAADNMLSHICKLENVDPFLLLPQERHPSNQVLKSAGEAPGGVVGMQWNRNRAVHHKYRLSKTTNIFPATVEVDKNKNLCVNISTAIENTVGEEIVFAAELYVSKLLEKQMGSAYAPEVHWTSHLRSKAGLTPFENDDTTASTFTIDDVTGAFTEMLLKNGYKKAGSWRNCPTYHIEVSPSEGGLLSTFYLDPYQIQKAWICNVGMTTSTDEVYVLIRITDVRSNPEIALFVDPWQMHVDGLLSLVSTCQYEANFSRRPPAIFLRGPEDLSSSKSGHEKSFGKLFHRKKHSQNQIPPKQADSLYSYDHLRFEEIRLLELFPGSGGMPIEGVVLHTKVNESRPYFAISYVWGPALKPFHLQTTDGRIPLTASLHSALERLRDSNESIFLWVDAICINQDDDHEKAIQIRMFQRIFQSAELVFAWIGNEKDNSSRALETLLQIRTLAVRPDDWPENLPAIRCDWNDGAPPSTDTVWWDIGDLFQREWFRRVWVVPEVVLAYEIRLICGTWEVDWDDIVEALEICLNRIDSLRLPDSRLRQMVTHLKPAYALGLTRRAFKERKLSNQFNLLSLLNIFASTESTKECDKLFAMLGIASDTGDGVSDPDYSSSLEQVVRRYADEFVRRGNAIDLLYKAGSSKSYDSCSWIPKWTGREPCRTISTWRGTKGIFSAAAYTSAHAQSFPLLSGQLQVLGVHVDTITKTSKVTTQERDVISVVNDVYALIDELNSYPTGEPISEIKLKVPIGDAIAPCADDVTAIEDVIKDNDDHEVGFAFNWNESFSAVSSIQDMINFLTQPRDARERSWKYWTTAAAFLKRLSNGRFVITEKGYVGVAPYDAEKGDKICVLHGGAVPFVLRKVIGGNEGKNKAYNLIGEAYIHGIMYGKAMEFEGNKKRYFVLV